MKNHHKAIYFTLLTSCELIGHLNEIDDEANKMYELLEKDMKARQGITEALKSSDQLEWGAGVRWTPLPQAEAPTEPTGETVA